MGETTRMANEAMVTAELIKPMLAGRDPAVQSAVLAELVATWICGHRDAKDPFGPPTEAVHATRRDIYEGFTGLVWELVEHEDKARGRRHG